MSSLSIGHVDNKGGLSGLETSVKALEIEQNEEDSEGEQEGLTMTPEASTPAPAIKASQEQQNGQGQGKGDGKEVAPESDKVVPVVRQSICSSRYRLWTDSLVRCAMRAWPIARSTGPGGSPLD